MDYKWKVLLELSNTISGRWTIPILIAMSLKGDRFTPLQTKTGATPARLSENLKNMCEAGLLHHLSPYERRHPLLPEYVLTEKGLLYKQAAMAISNTASGIHGEDLLYKQWNLSILFSLLNQKERFTDIKKELEGITSKMLSNRLTLLQEQSLVEKNIVSVTPIIPHYSLTDLSFKPIKHLAFDLLSIV